MKKESKKPYPFKTLFVAFKLAYLYQYITARAFERLPMFNIMYSSDLIIH